MMQTDLIGPLVSYGLSRLAQTTQGDPAQISDRIAATARDLEAVWESYEDVVSGGHKAPPEAVLTSIFSLIPTQAGKRPQPHYWVSCHQICHSCLAGRLGTGSTLCVRRRLDHENRETARNTRKAASLFVPFAFLWWIS